VWLILLAFIGCGSTKSKMSCSIIFLCSSSLLIKKPGSQKAKIYDKLKLKNSAPLEPNLCNKKDIQ